MKTFQKLKQQTTVIDEENHPTFIRFLNLLFCTCLGILMIGSHYKFHPRSITNTYLCS